MHELIVPIVAKHSSEQDEISQSIVERCARIALETMELCTHPEGMEYYAYVQRIIDSGNRTALNVKLNDLHHNIARGHAFGYDRLIAKHSRALKMIEDALKTPR